MKKDVTEPTQAIVPSAELQEALEIALQPLYRQMEAMQHGQAVQLNQFLSELSAMLNSEQSDKSQQELSQLLKDLVVALKRLENAVSQLHSA